MAVQRAGRIQLRKLADVRRMHADIRNRHGVERVRTHPGKLEVLKERVGLTSRGYTFFFPREAVADFVVERDVGSRIRGLPVVTIRLVGGEVVRVASLGGAGSLHEIAQLLAVMDVPLGARPQS